MRNGTKVLAFAGLALAVMQVFPVDMSNPPEDGPLVIRDAAVAEIVDRACADCHTHDTNWPWYSKVAPVSWWLADHVNEGREHFNLSVWEGQTARRRDHKLEEFVEFVESGEMPLASYKLGHPEARITQAERETLIEWANAQRAEIDLEATEGN